ncbi:hypothetical protein K3N28_19145 [Glycomyces sp. TRM65418]|uniref:hypothetical protein n=1 Tax=Glycomyces sp. TRM65418 TaxID=2867006 RepID=UPI001CE6B95C|nr:hypothetical protein [Glycomyces sp. TRM65418]MCC3765178.1 hypothetical protein [Glycomyces sp. TRM65418]QZD54803.1 hypothetical protein K3N28_19050 [Glycomyces sp. TRM65418]
MTDTESQKHWERSQTSSCGNVTVTIAPGQVPAIELADGAERMHTRDLAELITATARAAADAARAAAPEPEAAPSIEDTIAVLAELRGDLRDNGLDAAIERRRNDAVPPGERDGPRERQFTDGPTGLVMPPFADELLSESIALLERFKHQPPGSGKNDRDAQPTGAAKSESKLVAVESTMAYPIASVWLSKRAFELGPRALTRELNETAAAAVADLAGKEDDYYAGLGLPIGPGDLGPIAEENQARGERATQDLATLQERQREMTRLFNQGGYFA